MRALRPKQLILAALGLSGAALAGGLWIANLRHGPATDLRRYPVHGVDVSHHQGVITWGRLPRQGVRFAYVKASEGGDLRDPLFRAAARQARDAGLAVGAYHYFTLCRPGAVQAANFLDAVDGVSTDLPPAVDLEFEGNCRPGPTSQPFERELGVFLDRVERGAGREPILYTTPEFYRRYLIGGSFKGRPVWMRGLSGGPDTARGARVVLRQYASDARLDGVEGRIDLDAFMGSEKAFADLRRLSGPRG